MKRIAVSKVLLGIALPVILAGCSTPAGYGWNEYYFGAADPQREAELTCIRYSLDPLDCHEARLRQMADLIAPYGMRCTTFTEKATAMAKEWGYSNLSYVYLPGDNTRAGHVSLLVTVDGDPIVVDNGFADSIEFSRAGSLEAYKRSVAREGYVVPREFSGAEARRADVPISPGDLLLTVDDRFDSSSAEMLSSHWSEIF